MKKYFSFAMAIIAMLAMVSSGCSSDDGVENGTSIKTNPTLSLSKIGGVGRLKYEILGVDNSNIDAKANVDWISAFDFTEPNYVQFNYTALADENATRKGQITLSYPGAADVVVEVIQGGDLTFELSIDESTITENGCKILVVPSDESQLYMCAIVSKSYIDSFSDEADFIEDDIDYWKGFAEDNGQELSTLLNLYGRKGTQTVNFRTLEPDHEYYGYVYGVTLEGKPTSALYKIAMQTLNVEFIDLTFDVTYEQINVEPYPDNNVYNVKVTVKPNIKDAGWYFTAMNSFVYGMDGYTEESIIDEVKTGMREQKPTLYKGDKEFMLKDALISTIRVWGGNDYYFWFFGMTDSYNINCEVQKKTITTAPIPVTDDCKFDVDLLSVTAQDCQIKVTPSNPNTNYFIGMYPGARDGKPSTVDKYGANACVERLLQRLDQSNSDLGDGNAPNWQTNEWVQKGELTTRMGADLKWRIDPELTYKIVIFGFDKYGHRTTEISVTDFETPEYTPPTSFPLTFEFSDVEMRSFVCKVTPPEGMDDVWYHVGITSAQNFDMYPDWRKFLDELIHANGGGTLAQYVGEETLKSTCTPGTEYVVYGFAYAGGQPQSDLVSARVKSVDLPRNMNVDVSVTWKNYNGTEISALYPGTYPAKDYGQQQYVFISEATRANEESTHTWVFLHQARSVMDLSDMLIFDYFETYPMFGWYDSPRARYSPPGEGPWGLFYCAQDELGAFGELHYEEIMMNDPAHQGDPKTVPTSGFEDKKDWGVAKSTMNMSAPIRFSKASFIQNERQRADARNANATIYNAPKKEVSVKENFDMKAQIKAISENIK